jgi:hypothetical protein
VAHAWVLIMLLRVPPNARCESVGLLRSLSPTRMERPNASFHRIDGDQNLSAPLIECVAAPRPVARIIDQAALYGIGVHISELLDSLLAAPNIEVIETLLPELRQTLRAGGPGFGLGNLGLFLSLGRPVPNLQGPSNCSPAGGVERKERSRKLPFFMGKQEGSFGTRTAWMVKEKWSGKAVKLPPSGQAVRRDNPGEFFNNDSNLK